MLKKTLTGIFMAGLLFLILWLTSFSHFVFDGVVLAVGIFSTYEMYTALHSKAEGKESFDISVVALCIHAVAVYPLCYFFGYGGLLFSFIVSALAAFISFIFDQKKHFRDFSATVFVLLYPLTLLSILFILNKDYGMIPVLFAIGIGTISDVFAYYFGKFFGKKKIFPKVSPKKTYVGCLAGIVGGAIGGIVVYLIFELGGFPTGTEFTFTEYFQGNVAATVCVYAAIGLAVSVFSEIGDLAASRIKREVGIKDYGKVLGSHGGLLDRIDSILFTSVCMGIVMAIISAIGV